MTRVCVRHPFERSENLCGHCGQEFCRDCLVFPHGPRKQPICVQCGLAAGGVRSNARLQPAMPRRELKRLLKERQKEDKALEKVQRTPFEVPDIANPFSPGWAMGDDAAPDPFAPPARIPPPPPAPGAPPTAAPSVLHDAPVAPAAAAPPPSPFDDPTFAPVEIPGYESVEQQTVPVAAHAPVPTPAPPAAPTLADLLPSVARAAEPTASVLTDEPDEDEEEHRRPRALPMLRRREPPVDDGKETSEMMAWLDEVFAPKPDDR
jgi:hypothetical protein